MERHNLVRCISCQLNADPNCKLCMHFNSNKLDNRPVTGLAKKNKHSQDLYLRQFDESQTTHISTPIFMDDRSMFDLNTREDDTNFSRKNAKNDILFSRTVSTYNDNKINYNKTDSSRKETHNPRLDFGLFNEPIMSKNMPDMSNMNGSMSSINNDMININNGMTRINGSMSNMNGSMSNINGSVSPQLSNNLPFQGFHDSNILDVPKIPNNIPKNNMQSLNIVSPAINIFAVNILNAYYSILSKKKFLFSPYLLFITLYSFLRGSHGSTEKEIENMLLFENVNKNEMFNMLANIHNLILDSSDIIMANTLINNIEIPIRAGYYKVVKNMMSLSMINVKKFQAEIDIINKQFSAAMKNTLSNIITINTFASLEPSNFNMAVIQSMHYYSKWKLSFDKNNTFKEFFLQTDLKHRLVDMMNMFNSEHWFIQKNNVKLIEMEYSNNRFRFGCYLTENVKQESYINPNELTQLIGKLQKVVINTLKIPKFTQTSKFYVDELYKKILDSNTLFTDADIPYISPKKNILINKIIQQVTLVINEEGESIIAKQKSPVNITFSANRPFYYYIRHVPTNVIVLMGTYE